MNFFNVLKGTHVVGRFAISCLLVVVVDAVLVFFISGGGVSSEFSQWEGVWAGSQGGQGKP